MFVFIDRAAGRRRGGHYVGRSIRIHGHSYTFQEELGAGGFGNFR